MRYEGVYDAKDYDQIAKEEKVRKYNDLLGFLKLQNEKEVGEVIPIVVGARGAMPQETTRHLKNLGFSKSEILTMSMIALRCSIKIADNFIDY